MKVALPLFLFLSMFSLVASPFPPGEEKAAGEIVEPKVLAWMVNTRW